MTEDNTKKTIEEFVTEYNAATEEEKKVLEAFAASTYDTDELTLIGELIDNDKENSTSKEDTITCETEARTPTETESPSTDKVAEDQAVV